MTVNGRVGEHRPGDYRLGRSGFRRAILGLFDTALTFQTRMSGSEWAERYGWIPKGTGAESGPVTLYGYQRGLLDAMCDPRIPLVTVMKAARVGYTRCATLALAYHLHYDPALCAVAQPTIPDAEDFGGSEIAPMLRETPVLAELLRPLQKRREAGQGHFHPAQQRRVGAGRRRRIRRRLPALLGALPGRRRDRWRGLDAGRKKPGRQTETVLDPRRDLLEPQADPRLDAAPGGDLADCEAYGRNPTSAAILCPAPIVARSRCSIGAVPTCPMASNGRWEKMAGSRASGTSARAAA